ncbi:hypothetical protein QVD17_38570 [Tagetes erecta]|uniref:Cytochrome P450 n=1 Tax=Tagetes erecta TaxID=13708 RepID=A0AAD8JSD7_TARER|nr:hypothetical protein QVD17_38570 [Tagetes erecta]
MIPKGVRSGATRVIYEIPPRHHLVTVPGYFRVSRLHIHITKTNEKFNPESTPGPWKLPLIGSIHHLGSSLPHKRLRDLANKYGPLMHLQLGELSVVVVSSPETAKDVMKTHDVNFADRPFLYASSVICNGATNLTFAAYGDYWRRVRKICTQELLSPMRVQSFRPTREQEVSKFIKSISEHVGSQINVSERIFSLTYGITAKAAFGKKCKDEELFIALVKEASAAAAGFNISDLFPSSTLLPKVTGFKAKIEKFRERFQEIAGNIIKEHKDKKADANDGVYDEDEDFVDVLLRFQECSDAKFPLSIANIKAIILIGIIHGLASVETCNFKCRINVDSIILIRVRNLSSSLAWFWNELAQLGLFWFGYTL